MRYKYEIWHKTTYYSEGEPKKTISLDTLKDVATCLKISIASAKNKTEFKIKNNPPKKWYSYNMFIAYSILKYYV